MKIQIKIEKFAKVNQGVLYTWFLVTNTETQQTDRSKSVAYYGDDIINNGSYSEQELMSMDVIHGKRDSITSKLLSSEVRTYNEDTCVEELEREGWENSIHEAILSIL